MKEERDLLKAAAKSGPSDVPDWWSRDHSAISTESEPKCFANLRQTVLK